MSTCFTEKDITGRMAPGKYICSLHSIHSCHPHRGFIVLKYFTLSKFLGRSQEDHEEREVPKGHEWIF